MSLLPNPQFVRLDENAAIPNFSDFQNDELKDYVRFKDILIDFRGFYDLETYNLKQIDQYVWQLGKDYFPKNYGKKKRGDKQK